MEAKIADLKERFTPLSPEERYAALIALGRTLPPFPPSEKSPENLVPGCQSTLYLSTTCKDDRLYFSVFSDALISAGLGALLASLYSGETPKTILTTPPTFLTDLGITTSLSPTRANGLASLYRAMQRAALQAASKK